MTQAVQNAYVELASTILHERREAVRQSLQRPGPLSSFGKREPTVRTTVLIRAAVKMLRDVHEANRGLRLSLQAWKRLDRIHEIATEFGLENFEPMKQSPPRAVSRSRKKA